jgi:hypothetical protein
MEKDEKLICYLDAILAEKKIKGQRITKTYLAKQLGVTKQFLTAVAKSKSNSSMLVFMIYGNWRLLTIVRIDRIGTKCVVSQMT